MSRNRRRKKERRSLSSASRNGDDVITPEKPRSQSRRRAATDEDVEGKENIDASAPNSSPDVDASDPKAILVSKEQGAAVQRKRSKSASKRQKQQEDALNARQLQAEAKKKEEMEQKFIAYHGKHQVAEGFSFNLKSGQRIIQATPQRDAGTYRLRVTLTDPSDPKSMLWNPNHEVFIGVSYGTQALFGYICGISAFQGVFALRTFSLSTSKNKREGDENIEIEAKNTPVHLTGSGNKVEFDVSLEAEMQRINRIVCCKLCVILNNLSITEDPFQISHDTLKTGYGLRFNILAGENGVSEEGIDVQLAWVGGGSVERLEKEK